MAQINLNKTQSFVNSPQDTCSFGFDAQGFPVKIDEFGNVVKISTESEDGIPSNIVATLGIGPESELPETANELLVYVSNDTFKKFKRVVNAWQVEPLVKTQLITDAKGVVKILWQYDGVSINKLTNRRSFVIVNSDFIPLPDVNYFIDASAGPVQMTLPTVTLNDDSRYFMTLYKVDNHCKIVVDGGVQLIGGNDFISIASENSYMEFVANKVDGYNIVIDGRHYDKVINITDDITLTHGYESGALYIGNLDNSVTKVITIANPTIEHVGQYASFIKLTGNSATLRIVSIDGAFSESITQNNKGFSIVCVYDVKSSSYKYLIKQDSRPTQGNVAVNFYPTSTTSSLVPSYKKLETELPPEEEMTTIPITSTDTLNPTSLGFYINDNKILVNTIPTTNLNAYAQLKKGGPFNNNVQIKFRYYQYDYENNVLGPIILETMLSPVIDSDSYTETVVTAVLPSYEWAVNDLVGNTLVIELLAIKIVEVGVNDDPTLIFRFGGTSPSRTLINIPATSINHDSLGGVTQAGPGVSDGHVSHLEQTFAGPKSFQDTTRFIDSLFFGTGFGNYLMIDEGDGTLEMYSNFSGPLSYFMISAARKLLLIANELIELSVYGSVFHLENDLIKIITSVDGICEIDTVLKLKDKSTFAGTEEVGLVRRNGTNVEFYDGEKWAQFITNDTNYRRNMSVTAIVTQNERVDYSRPLIGAVPDLKNYEGLPIALLSWDDSGFNYKCLAPGKFGYEAKPDF